MTRRKALRGIKNWDGADGARMGMRYALEKYPIGVLMTVGAARRQPNRGLWYGRRVSGVRLR